MGWNSPQVKSLQDGIETKSAKVPVGSPVASNAGLTGRPYRDGWDIERAYREGMQKVTWVYRCVDAIAGNQARLPVILRGNNSPDGKITTGSDNEILKLLNTKANVGENSFIFRYRVSSQLLLSTRGVFIEKIYGNNGSLIGLHLLPPQHTAPIPDPKNFVSGFEVSMPSGQKVFLKPENVVWLRRPHPLDPYRSMTPMESAGVAIEIENLAKIYNRNFLLNDGRPGGLLVVRGEMDDDDKDELRSRFRGNLNRAGTTSVISSEDGVDYVDTASSPRDAAYVEMRNLSKEEILSAFGVPETAIGNAAGRTFSNASEELRVFWMETMLPHLDTLGRGLDELDPKYYIDFDTAEVPILVLYKQERERYLMTEFQTGLISGNEYRTGTGRDKIKSELMDSLLANPNLTPIGNTEKEFNPNQQQPVDMAGTGAPPPGQIPGSLGAEMAGEAPAPEAAPAGAEVPPAEPVPAGQASAVSNLIRHKTIQLAALSEFDQKVSQAEERWTEILDKALDRLFERQQRVVLEKASGAKSRKMFASGSLPVESIFDVEIWNKQMKDDIRPIISAIISESNQISAKQLNSTEVSQEELNEYVDAQMERMQQTNNTTKEEITAAILTALALAAGGDEDDGHSLLITALTAIFAYLMLKRKRKVAEHESQAAVNAGLFLSAREKSDTVKKTWLTKRDVRVRPEHALLHSKTVAVEDGFVVGDAVLRFPGDPLAPPNLTFGCRCKLRFS
jgi:HK97 family phage portal protein